jgi:hypothetical protein
MKRALRHLWQGALTAAVIALVVVLGQLPMGRPSGEATVRLALRTVQGRIEVCRELSEAEVANLPQHMRRGETCEQTPVVYRLKVALDGVALVDERVEPGGLRRDRPHIVDRQIQSTPGRKRLEVSFEPELEVDGAVPEALSEVPAYRLDEELDLAEDRIALVLLDDGAGRLFVYGG